MTNEKQSRGRRGVRARIGESGDDALFVGCVLLDLGNGVFDRNLSFGLLLIVDC
jgi:hypothetical protein